MAVDWKDKVAPEISAVLLVDLQNDFCHPNGAWKEIATDPDLSKRVEAIQSFLPQARTRAVPVLFVRTVYNAWTTSPPIRQRWQQMGMDGLCTEGSWGAEFYQVLPQETDRVVTKYRPSGFMETDLDLTLRAKDVQTVLIAGMGVWGGAFDTARDTVAKNYQVLLLDDCVGGGTPQERLTLIEIFRRYHADVVESREVIEAWNARK